MLKSIGGRLGSALAPRAGKIAPGPTAKVVHRALSGAIKGIGPLDGAAEIADAALKEAGGSKEKAIDAIVSSHLKLAAGQGFLTNLGGLVTLAATVPANISGLALLQCRMVAAIAAVHGHDLADDGVRNAVLACTLGEDVVDELVKKDRLPGRPRALAAGDAGPVSKKAAAEAAAAEREAEEQVGHEGDDDPTAPGRRTGETELDRVVASQVATALISSVLGKRLAVTVGKRVPLIGGVVGAGTDAWSTRKIAQYARVELAR